MIKLTVYLAIIGNKTLKNYLETLESTNKPCLNEFILFIDVLHPVTIKTRKTSLLHNFNFIKKIKKSETEIFILVSMLFRRLRLFEFQKSINFNPFKRGG